jgi:hypothetical protein
MLFEAIVDHRNDGTALQEEKASVKNSSGVARNVETMKGWECLIQWHDGSAAWNKTKDVKDSYPVQLAEHAVENALEREPLSRWWVACVLKKRERIIKKVKSSHWAKTPHKHGFEVPKTHLDCILINKESKDTQWQDAVRKEMKTVRPAFETHEGEIKALVGCQQIRCQFMFDVKLGEGFRKKARLVALGNRTQTPATLTCTSVVSRDSARIALTAAALNELDMLVCDMEGAHLTAKCREKVWVEAGPEFGSEARKIMIVKMALCGLKSLGAAFRSKLAGVSHDLNCRPSLADPDVWLRAATKPCGFEHCEMVLCYVDDVMVISHEPGRRTDGIKAAFKLKGDEASAPDMHLGVTLEKKPNSKGADCWTMAPEKCIKAAIENVEKKLGGELPFSKGQCSTPMRTDCHPAEDTHTELDAEGLGCYQELIGVLRWVVEIGRLDILLETSLLSSHLALPRKGHLEQVCHIFTCLKHGSRRRIYLDPSCPPISESPFQACDWTDFCKCAEEPIPSNMPTARGRIMSAHCFVDSDHAGDKVSRSSQTGMLIFCNAAPIMACSKRQNLAEESTHRSELVAMRQAINLVKGLRCKLRMFGIPAEGPTDVFCDNESVFKNVSVPESVLSKKQHSVSMSSCCKRSCRSWDCSNRKGKHADKLVGCFHQNSEQAKEGRATEQVHVLGMMAECRMDEVTMKWFHRPRGPSESAHSRMK